MRDLLLVLMCIDEDVDESVRVWEKGREGEREGGRERKEIERERGRGRGGEGERVRERGRRVIIGREMVECLCGSCVYDVHLCAFRFAEGEGRGRQGGSEARGKEGGDGQEMARGKGGWTWRLMGEGCVLCIACCELTGCRAAQDGDTPLICASYNGQLEVVSFLLGKGANIEAKDKVSFVYVLWLM